MPTLDVLVRNGMHGAPDQLPYTMCYSAAVYFTHSSPPGKGQRTMSLAQKHNSRYALGQEKGTPRVVL